MVSFLCEIALFSKLEKKTEFFRDIFFRYPKFGLQNFSRIGNASAQSGFIKTSLGERYFILCTIKLAKLTRISALKNSSF